MKQIALIGAPGSGKTELANELAQKLEGDTQIIDNYIKDIEIDSDLVLGLHATYIGNLYVVLGRYALERHAIQAKADTVITCGTLVDSSVYATLQAVSGQTEAHWVRITNFMNVLGSFYQDTWRYDTIFHLPLEDVEKESDEDRINAALNMAIEAFGVKPVKLIGENKIETALDAINVVDEPAPTN